MVHPAWFTGIITNSLIPIILTFCLIRLQKEKKIEYSISGLSPFIAIAGLIITSLGTLLLYLQQGIVQQNLGVQDTIYPLFLWIGYYIASNSFLALALSESKLDGKYKIAIQLAVLTIYFISSFGMIQYLIYWNDGAVLVTFSNTFADIIGTFASLGVGVIALSIAIIRRLEYVHMKNEDSPKGGYVYLLVASITFLMNFVVPRAQENSFINPVTVKFIGIILFLSFAFSIYKYSINRSEPAPYEKNPSIDYETLIRDSDMHLIEISVIWMGIYVILTRLNPPILDVVDKLNQGIPILYLGEWNNYSVYADYIGCVFPLVLGLVLIPFLIRILNLGAPTKSGILILFLSGLLSFSIATIDAIIFRPISPIESPPVNILYFVISPVIVWGILSVLVYKRNGVIDNHLDNRESTSKMAFALSLFSVTVLSTIFFDVLTAISPFGIIHLGGAGITDGLIWAPTVTVCVFTVLLIIADLLKLGISPDYLWN